MELPSSPCTILTQYVLGVPEAAGASDLGGSKALHAEEELLTAFQFCSRGHVLFEARENLRRKRSSVLTCAIAEGCIAGSGPRHLSRPEH